MPVPVKEECGRFGRRCGARPQGEIPFGFVKQGANHSARGSHRHPALVPDWNRTSCRSQTRGHAATFEDGAGGLSRICWRRPISLRGIGAAT